MHGINADRSALEREALRNVIQQWNANRLDIFELSEPNEDLEFHGVMRFYFQDSGQKVATKCIRVASDATVEDVIGTLIEKFRPDMRMLSVPSYALFELHEHCAERKMAPDEKPLLVQLNWHVDDREGRFLLRNIDDKTLNSVGLSDSNLSFKRKLSKREKKQLKKQEKLSRMKSDASGENEVAEKLYSELPETSFTRSISNPEAVMRRRRQQKLERKLQQFRSKDGGPDTGGTLKIYGEALCRDVPYKTLLLSVRDTAGMVVREMLDKYGQTKVDPQQWCLVQVTQGTQGAKDVECVLDDDECPLGILMNAPTNSSIMFHVRRRPADCAPRKRKKKPGGGIGGTTTIGSNREHHHNHRQTDAVPILVELGPDGSVPHPSDSARTIRLSNELMEVGSSNGIALQLYGPHIQPRHCVITSTPDGVTALTPCHADAHTYVNGQRIHQTTALAHGALVKFGNSNTYRYLDPLQEMLMMDGAKGRLGGGGGSGSVVDTHSLYDRSPQTLSPNDVNKENFETTFDLEGNVETISTASGPKEDSRSIGSASENRLAGMDRSTAYQPQPSTATTPGRGQDPILPAVLEFPEEHQDQFLARVITHLDVSSPTFRLSPAFTLYLCGRYRASTHYRPELTPTERAHKLTLLLQHAAMLVRHTVQDRSTEASSQAFWLANASELLHFLKSDRHVSAFSLQAQDTLADAVQLSFKNLVACLTDDLNSVLITLLSDGPETCPQPIVDVLGAGMQQFRNCRVNAALTIQFFSQLFHWLSARALSVIINNPSLCCRAFGLRLGARLRSLQVWAESQGLELAAECHLAKVIQCATLLQANKGTAEELARLSSACFKLNSLQLRALLTQYKPEPGEPIASPSLLDQAAHAAEDVADELARADGREVRLHDDPTLHLQLLLPDDGYSCDVVVGVPPGLADFLHPLQASGLCRLAAQPTSSGQWTVYMTAARPTSAMSTQQPELTVIRLHKSGGGMGLSIVAAKGAGQERLGIYIKSVVPGGAADRDGRLAAGDQLLSVDGQSLLGITQEKAAEFLVRTGSVVTLSVAKGGAVYHGLATLLQQPSPTPQRAALDTSAPPLGAPSTFYRKSFGSCDISSVLNRRSNIPYGGEQGATSFYHSSDELCRNVPHIIETDFTGPEPHSQIILSTENLHANVPIATTTMMRVPGICIELADDDDSNVIASLKGVNEDAKLASISLQDLSDSSISVNSHDSELDLSHTSRRESKLWKSPSEIRRDHLALFNKSYLFTRPVQCKHAYNNKLSSYEKWKISKLLDDWSKNGSSGVSSDVYYSLNFNTRKSCILKPTDQNEPAHVRPFNELSNMYASMPDLCSLDYDSTLGNLRDTKQFSESSINRNQLAATIFHKCKYKNCIFNIDFKKHFARPHSTILDDSISDLYQEDIIKSASLQRLNTISSSMSEDANTDETLETVIDATERRRSDDDNDKNVIPLSTSTSNLDLDQEDIIKSASLQRLNTISSSMSEDAYTDETLETVIDRCRSDANNVIPPSTSSISLILQTDVVVDDSHKSDRRVSSAMHHSQSETSFTTNKSSRNPQGIIRMCCRYAQPYCPVTIEDDDNDSAGCGRRRCRLRSASASVSAQPREYVYLLRYRGRRMSERDLPSRINSDADPAAQQRIPSSKSVPALHHISPNSEQHHPHTLPNNHHHHHTNTIATPPAGGPHDIFNPGYSRTSSSNSIHQQQMQQAMQQQQQQQGRSKSTHSLYQQQQQQQGGDGFYQNLSVYRNSGGAGNGGNSDSSPKQLGDRTSAHRVSQNSLHTSNQPQHLQQQSNQQPPSNRPVSAYYNSNPDPVNTPPSGRLPLHLSIPNLKTIGTPNPNSPHYQQQLQQQQYQQQRMMMMQQQQQQYAGFGSPTQSVDGAYGSPNGGFVHGAHQGGLLQEDVRNMHGRQDEMVGGYGGRRAVENGYGPPNGEQLMRMSKSEDLLRQSQPNLHHGAHDQLRYASSVGNVTRTQESSRVELPQLRHALHDGAGDNMPTRGQAKLMEMGEELRRRQLREQQHQQNNMYVNKPPHHHNMPQQSLLINSQMQNLSLNQQQAHKTPPVAPKPPLSSNNSTTGRIPSSSKPPIIEDAPELPPTTTHPLYVASAGKVGPGTVGRDPWVREEREREAEVRREQARHWQEQQIRELQSMSVRSVAQEEQLRVLRLEREFQRRAQEAAEQEEEDTEKDSPIHPSQQQHQPRHQHQVSSYPASKQPNLPMSTPATVSILKHQQSAPNVLTNNHHQQQQQQQQQLSPNSQQQHHIHREREVPNTLNLITHQQQHNMSPSHNNHLDSPTLRGNMNLVNSGTGQVGAPPPPERASSYQVMSMRTQQHSVTASSATISAMGNREGPKRVSFNDVGSAGTAAIAVQDVIDSNRKDMIREDPDAFIRQAESMLASPTSPTSPNTNTPLLQGATPGVIGAQEVYRDPRTRRLAEQAQQKTASAPSVPEKLTFKEKMKMFAMETGETSTPRDKSKISRAQREIDNMGGNNASTGAQGQGPNSSLVH